MWSTVLAIVPPSVRRRIRAHGRVQGVFFRDSVRRAAASRGVAGWARNCSDGTVEAVFEGPEDAVEAMVELCRAGPGSASVSSLDVVDEPPESLSGFTVR
jgi:acylphosphatase